MLCCLRLDQSIRLPVIVLFLIFGVFIFIVAFLHVIIIFFIVILFLFIICLFFFATLFRLLLSGIVFSQPIIQSFRPCPFRQPIAFTRRPCFRRVVKLLRSGYDSFLLPVFNLGPILGPQAGVRLLAGFNPIWQSLVST